MTRLKHLLGLGVAVVSIATQSAADDRGDSDRARFTGNFRFAGDAREQAARRAAIDRAIDGLFFAIRGIARSRLSDGTSIDPTVAISFGKGTIRVRVPQAPEAVSPDSGAAIDYVSDGEKSKLSQRLVAGKLTQVFAADDGRRTNEFTLSPDGATLTERVVVTSPKLSAPVIYVLTYKRM